MSACREEHCLCCTQLGCGMTAIQGECLLEAGLGIWVRPQLAQNGSRLDKRIDAAGFELDAPAIGLHVHQSISAWKTLGGDNIFG